MKMIPAMCPEYTKSNAEREVFEFLGKLDMPGVVLYSLQLHKHVEKIQSEIDFVVITNRGVLCLEVKGGEVNLNNGVWEFGSRGDRSSQKKEGPFEQASTAAYSLRSYVYDNYGKEIGKNIKRCLYGHGVLFPDIIFRERGPEINNEIICDRSGKHDLGQFITGLYDYWEKKLAERVHIDQSRIIRLNNNEISILEGFLRKTFIIEKEQDCYNFKAVDGRLNQLSEEQMRIFRYGIQNPRQLVSGVAGTGKTIIAICHAVEQAKAGDRVLFICFNKLLADWVDKEITYRLSDVNNKVKVINFHNLLLEVVGCDIPSDNLSMFYNEELPAQFLDKLEYEPLDEADLLIIDEGQDLFMADYILCLDKMVKGGLENGRWITFYDEFQNIYLRQQFIEGVEMMRSFSPFMGTLETNYRNSRQIHDANHKITSIENGRFNGIDGDEVAYFGYQNNEEAKKELKNIVKSLVKQKVSFEDIVILSPYKFHHSIIEGNRYLFEGITQIQPMQNEKGDITKLAPGTIRFSTIYSFKGMESHVIILIDINKQDEEAMRLYYTGISRAKSKLFVLYDKNKFTLS